MAGNPDEARHRKFSTGDDEVYCCARSKLSQWEAAREVLACLCEEDEFVVGDFVLEGKLGGVEYSAGVCVR